MRKRWAIVTIALIGMLSSATRTVYADSDPFHTGGTGILVAEIDGEEAADGVNVNIEIAPEEATPTLRVTDFTPIEKSSRDYSGTFLDGILFGPLDLSDMTYDEAIRSITLYKTTLGEKTITLTLPDAGSRTYKADDLGLEWKGENELYEAFSIGKGGNVVTRYKALKDLEREPRTYDITFSFNHELIADLVRKQAKTYDIEPSETTVYRENDEFVIEEGNAGRKIDITASVKAIEDVLTDWDGTNKTVALSVDVQTPKGTRAELEKMTDVLGTWTTGFRSSNANRAGNLITGAEKINGTVLYPGEEFSTYNAVAPFTTENGYFKAGSYSNGQVVETIGGGICQVSTTLYNAVLLAELEVTERYNHSMVVKYVKLSGDAAISGTEKDFKFKNNRDYPIYIEGVAGKDKMLTFTIYGVETRPENRTIELESIEISKDDPGPDTIVTDPGKPVGYVKAGSSHVGYTGEYWKIIKIDGVETERVQINKSYYRAIPRTVVVGTASADASASANMEAAAASGNLNNCYGVIAQSAASLAPATETTAED